MIFGSGSIQVITSSGWKGGARYTVSVDASRELEQRVQRGGEGGLSILGSELTLKGRDSGVTAPFPVCFRHSVHGPLSEALVGTSDSGRGA